MPTTGKIKLNDCSYLAAIIYAVTANWISALVEVAPRRGLELTTTRLNVGCSIRLHSDSFDLIETDVIMAPIIELGGAGAGVIGHGRGVLQGAPVLQIGGDPCRPKTMVAHLGRNPSRHRPPADHGIGIGLGQGRTRKLAGSPADGPE